MPIYAYRCTTCGHAQDVLRKISDPPLNVCPACGASTFVKQVTAAGFQLKGSGWYVTDFRGDKKSAKPADGDAAAPADAKPAEGGAAKDAPAADAKKSEPAAPSAAPAPAAAPAVAAPPPPAAAKGDK
jgi:putative FmdB family regulatory protein